MDHNHPIYVIRFGCEFYCNTLMMDLKGLSACGRGFVQSESGSERGSERSLPPRHGAFEVVAWMPNPAVLLRHAPCETSWI